MKLCGWKMRAIFDLYNAMEEAAATEISARRG